MRLAYSPRPASEIEIRTVLLGIDIGVAELLLADHLRRKGVLVDAVVAHHTPNAGVAFNLAQDIMGVNVEMLVAQGVPLEDARRVIDPYVHERWLGNEDFHRQGPPRRGSWGSPSAASTPRPTTPSRRGSGRCCSGSASHGGGRGAGPADYPRGAVRAHLGAFPRVMSGDPRQPLGRYMVKGGGGRIFPPGAYPLLGRAGVSSVIQIGCALSTPGRRRGPGCASCASPTRRATTSGSTLWLDSAIREHGPLEVLGCAAFERIERIERGPGA